MILNFIKKLPMILKAKLSKRQLTEDWQIERKKICDICPMNSLNYKKEKKAWYKFWNILNFKEPFCVHCGCELILKQKEEMEECPEGKWGKHFEE